MRNALRRELRNGMGRRQKEIRRREGGLRSAEGFFEGLGDYFFLPVPLGFFFSFLWALFPFAIVSLLTGFWEGGIATCDALRAPPCLPYRNAVVAKCRGKCADKIIL